MSAASGNLAENLAEVRERMALAASRAGRHPDEVTLIAVSKTHSAEKIEKLYEAGVLHFGENRVQEWEAKWPHLQDLRATVHMIGHLQKNKAARAVRLFDTIDSVDSIALAEKLDRAQADSSDEQAHAEPEAKPVLVEVKLDSQSAKSGVDARELPRLVEAILLLPHLELRGLMGVPPYFDDPAEARPYFRHLRQLRDALLTQKGMGNFPVLSMGMSHDFELAIEEGATEVRIGTALFGARGEP